MESYNPTNIEILTNGVISLQSLTENRVQALKSLTLMLLNELKTLENLNLRKDNFSNDSPISLAEEVENFEIEMIRSALIRAKGSQRVAASLLKTKVTTLNVKIKRYGIEPQGYKFARNVESQKDNFVMVTTIG
ncbi:MAG: hypothetical protein ABJA66_18335 [Actinomycetota bacterium]